MKKYQTPSIETIEVIFEEIMSTSTSFGDSWAGDTSKSWGSLF